MGDSDPNSLPSTGEELDLCANFGKLPAAGFIGYFYIGRFFCSDIFYEP